MNRSAIKDEMETRYHLAPRAQVVAAFRAHLARRPACAAPGAPTWPARRAAGGYAVIRNVSPYDDLSAPHAGCEVVSIEIDGRAYYALVEHLESVVALPASELQPAARPTPARPASPHTGPGLRIATSMGERLMRA